jgi:hypothetical protein
MFDKRVVIFSVIFFVAVSCSKIDDFGDINENPGTAKTPVPSALLTNVLSTLGNETWDAPYTNSAGLTTVSGLYCQYFSETQYTEQSTYGRPNINWDNYYSGKLYDLQTIINYNTDTTTAAIAEVYGLNNNQIAVARILKVYLFSLLTDCYGDLPYFNSLKADNGIVAYDAQQNIYADFFKELSEAVEQLYDSAAPKGDILFSGNITMWRKFANSLHAVLALHLSKADATTGAAEFNKALSSKDGVFEFNQNAQLNYPGTNYFNPVYMYYGLASIPPYTGVSSTIIDWLNNIHDNRLAAYATSLIGIPYGLTRDSTLAFYNAHSDWARMLKGAAEPASAPFPILTAAEIFLARAEAAQRGWIHEDVSTMYKNGITESLKYWNVYSDTAFASYISQPAIDLNINPLEKICEQEWIASYPNGLRGWNTWRRTGYPVLQPAPASSSHVIPRRFPYGTNEYGTNTDNVKKAAAQYTINGEPDSQYGRVWWDKE